MTHTAKILIMAGGTGGHVFPALAIAEQLRSQGIHVSWLGTRQGLEARLVPDAGFPIHFVRISGLRGKGPVRQLLSPFLVLVAILQSLWVILRVRPHVVLGMGGFVSGPGGVAAWLLHRPLFIHEQNAIPGMTNRLLARLATGAMEAFPGSFSAMPNAAIRCPVECTGNPVRRDIASLPPPSERLHRQAEALRILVLGGSQGAEILNEVVPKAIGTLVDSDSVIVRHQAGTQHLMRTRVRYENLDVIVNLVAFIDDMAEAYGWADLVVARAGAMTVTELTAAGVASILVPYPFAVDNHQTANARFLADAGAAVLVPQTELTSANLGRLFTEFHVARSQLVAMAEAARNLSIPDATKRVVMRCLNSA
uniref:UDP-N-acetylglucosamine--N-acetylmuramyl-(pentapeptide) pyrophosphoryl-undecaprenol N-acetylglucosamine transferase n=1 Tax=Candidatus Kentrum sp. FM TaxID=2126340 RepID=A0A450SLW5_9GAMM|nr:MAG: UDP-N-acetylglucosamine--N-acetylmuramyl-(pentapeptide) pyrophosphoryl-undecaprenol N-acetylglucosamine transferase [Candidatus Kentron sp. FM]VFJ54606.1 MAG: UDP-N-acetylglucosamine--N-acetylmuramyl-(pentapeptide) pyrophosphoryl-undecaprenol N-acetylglucosamine transferase [Candidatus Kentron sp. FM]VFK10542.1 MAG: UDP-N-acetylglucosamine--N-acetylmuramyl-(pentapeptide) pyrophosphoryl-undecaprenol N-acetylglucosamine transferase [Candidatus Kentron sp. FM]